MMQLPHTPLRNPYKLPGSLNKTWTESFLWSITSALSGVQQIFVPIPLGKVTAQKDHKGRGGGFRCKKASLLRLCGGFHVERLKAAPVHPTPRCSFKWSNTVSRPYRQDQHFQSQRTEGGKYFKMNCMDAEYEWAFLLLVFPIQYDVRSIHTTLILYRIS